MVETISDARKHLTGHVARFRAQAAAGRAGDLGRRAFGIRSDVTAVSRRAGPVREAWKAAGHISVDRSNRARAVQSLRHAAESIRTRRSTVASTRPSIAPGSVTARRARIITITIMTVITTTITIIMTIKITIITGTSISNWDVQSTSTKSKLETTRWFLSKGVRTQRRLLYSSGQTPKGRLTSATARRSTRSAS